MRNWGKGAGVLVGALAMASVASAATAATALDLFYERALMAAANAGCRLFAPDVATALAAAEAQARGAALRSGADPANLAGVQAKAAAVARAAGCGSPDIALAASRVRAAFEGYAQLDHMDFPGETAGWTAVRPASGAEAQWRVVQRDRFGWDEMAFGLVGHGQDRFLMAAPSFADGAAPYGARLVMRDVAVTSGPYLDMRQGDIAGRLPIDARLPPRSASQVFAATALSPAGTDLKAADMQTAWAIRFPPAALAALTALDPRELVAVEFLIAGRDGEEVRTAYVEVGDFDAALAFQSLPQR